MEKKFFQLIAKFFIEARLSRSILVRWRHPHIILPIHTNFVVVVLQLLYFVLIFLFLGSFRAPVTPLSLSFLIIIFESISLNSFNLLSIEYIQCAQDSLFAGFCMFFQGFERLFLHSCLLQCLFYMFRHFRSLDDNTGHPPYPPPIPTNTSSIAPYI